MDDGLAEALARLLDVSRTPGAAAALVGDGGLHWVHVAGVTNAEVGTTLDANSVFGVASLSKPVFAYGVLVLCQQGGLELDVPLHLYLPAHDGPGLVGVTARMVLSHTTGFPNERRAVDLPLPRLPPGGRFTYSGEGFLYLQHVVEHITGRPLDAWMRATVFEPLGMEASSFLWPSPGDPRATTGHDRMGRPLPKWRPDAGHAAASLAITPVDYARFLRAMLDPEWTDAPLSSPQVAAMLVPQVRINATVSWGLGWGLHGAGESPVFWHWGENGDGFTSFAIGVPATRLGLAVMTNGLNGPAVYEPLVRRLLPGYDPVFAFVRAADRYMV